MKWYAFNHKAGVVLCEFPIAGQFKSTALGMHKDFLFAKRFYSQEQVRKFIRRYRDRSSFGKLSPIDENEALIYSVLNS